MNKRIMLVGLFFSTAAIANDSTGYVSTGGVQYLKNPHISMESEYLFISKHNVSVNYNYKNLSGQDIVETVLFPLPAVQNYSDSDFASTSRLIDSFTVIANGKRIKPDVHIRAFMQPVKTDGSVDWDAEAIDVTKELKLCGLSDHELMSPWTQKIDHQIVGNKIHACRQSTVQRYARIFNYGEDLIWSSQVIYSWKQTFKANAYTNIQHQYIPLVGGSVSLYPAEDSKAFCMDSQFKAGLKKAKAQQAPYQALGYVLKTGANWAKPIGEFKMIIERDRNELVSFCWQGKVKKISPTQFQVLEKKFLPKQNLDIIFVQRASAE